LVSANVLEQYQPDFTVVARKGIVIGFDNSHVPGECERVLAEKSEDGPFSSFNREESLEGISELAILDVLIRLIKPNPELAEKQLIRRDNIVELNSAELLDNSDHRNP
jgi:hypothetical protein